jgi:two-component sensor histidine kinase
MAIQSLQAHANPAVANDTLRLQQLADYPALVQEVDHRLKNTIQSVASLLMLQARGCAAPEAREALEDASRRLGVFARVYELLGSNGAGDRTVSLGDVIGTLATGLRAIHSDRVALRVVADPVTVDSRLAISLSLLVNEAVTNAFKHAYPNGQAGEIFVRVAKTESGGLRIGIQDDGVGFSPNVCHDTLGLTLMRTFASQIGGHLAVLSDAGTTIQLTMLDGVTTRPNGHLGEGSTL